MFVINVKLTLKIIKQILNKQTTHPKQFENYLSKKFIFSKKAKI